ncbi:hypothetical protein CWI36_0648p0010 [Hamiltosporidium magnivora]|uniref:Uncharacterized protein n=1 Tax=Hamiltosporidium magnivora TaxID=148818 RepID=A0A4Q9LD28_9MICR|nr:hypothetical protein CWI36_0648p0010 [Hamiltosporidium magnivora]
MLLYFLFVSTIYCAKSVLTDAGVDYKQKKACLEHGTLKFEKLVYKIIERLSPGYSSDFFKDLYCMNVAKGIESEKLHALFDLLTNIKIKNIHIFYLSIIWQDKDEDNTEDQIEKLLRIINEHICLQNQKTVKKVMNHRTAPFVQTKDKSMKFIYRNIEPKGNMKDNFEFFEKIFSNSLQKNFCDENVESHKYFTILVKDNFTEIDFISFKGILLQYLKEFTLKNNEIIFSFDDNTLRTLNDICFEFRLKFPEIEHIYRFSYEKKIKSRSYNFTRMFIKSKGYFISEELNIISTKINASEKERTKDCFSEKKSILHFKTTPSQRYDYKNINPIKKDITFDVNDLFSLQCLNKGNFFEEKSKTGEINFKKGFYVLDVSFSNKRAKMIAFKYIFIFNIVGFVSHGYRDKITTIGRINDVPIIIQEIHMKLAKVFGDL